MRGAKVVLRFVLSVIFIFTGTMHFVRSEFFVAIVPPYLPFPEALVAVTGVAELALGAALLVPRWSRPAAWGLIALLIAVFPANLHMAMHHELYPQFSRTALWFRLPIQGVLIAWAAWFTR